MSARLLKRHSCSQVCARKSETRFSHAGGLPPVAILFPATSSGTKELHKLFPKRHGARAVNEKVTRRINIYHDVAQIRYITPRSDNLLYVEALLERIQQMRCQSQDVAENKEHNDAYDNPGYRLLIRFPFLRQPARLSATPGRSAAEAKRATQGGDQIDVEDAHDDHWCDVHDDEKQRYLVDEYVDVVLVQFGCSESIRIVVRAIFKEARQGVYGCRQADSQSLKQRDMYM